MAKRLTGTAKLEAEVERLYRVIEKQQEQLTRTWSFLQALRNALLDVGAWPRSKLAEDVSEFLIDQKGGKLGSEETLGRETSGGR